MHAAIPRTCIILALFHEYTQGLPPTLGGVLLQPLLRELNLLVRVSFQVKSDSSSMRVIVTNYFAYIVAGTVLRVLHGLTNLIHTTTL